MLGSRPWRPISFLRWTIICRHPSWGGLPGADDMHLPRRRRHGTLRRVPLPISSPPGRIGDQRAPYRPAREQRNSSRRHREVHIVPPGKRYRVVRVPETPNPHCLAGVRHNIVLPGKLYRLPQEIIDLNAIVPPGKNYRPARETLASGPGRNIVLHGNLYRPLWEDIPSCWGKVIVLPGKSRQVFPAKSCKS